jgi:beta-lactamase regulating signal transducer with metallopeptidase domain
MQILAILWVAGIAAMLAYAAISYIRIRGRVASATHPEDNIYKSGNIASPFIPGVVKPRIYLPDRISENEADYVTMRI